MGGRDKRAKDLVVKDKGKVTNPPLTSTFEGFTDMRRPRCCPRKGQSYGPCSFSIEDQVSWAFKMLSHDLTYLNDNRPSMNTSKMNSNTLHPPKERRSRSTSRQPAKLRNNEGSGVNSSQEDGKHTDNNNSEHKDGGGLSECDERNGEERKHAEESPAKGRQRITSKVPFYLALRYLS